MLHCGFYGKYIHVCLRETCVAALNQQRALDMSRTEESSEEDYSSHTDQLKALDRVFEKAAEEDKPTEVRLTFLQKPFSNSPSSIQNLMSIPSCVVFFAGSRLLVLQHYS